MLGARRYGVLAVVVAVVYPVGARPAIALDLFGGALFGQSSAVPKDALAYQVTLTVDAADGGALDKLIGSVSRLMAERERGANDAYTLVARARGDIAIIQAALYSEGYYGGGIDIRIGGEALDGLDPAVLGTEPGAAIDVAVTVAAGSPFVFGRIDIVRSAGSHDGPEIDSLALGLESGAPAKSGKIVAAAEKLTELWRAAGYPLARVTTRNVEADHARKAVDIEIEVDPGLPAVYGWIGVSGARTLDNETVLAQSALRPGQSFRPADLKRARDRLVKIPSVQSVRIVEGATVDTEGGIPISLEVVERKPRYFGATASLSTTDGAEIEVYWGHRNVFGSGEHLRVEGGISRLGSEELGQLEFDAATIYTRPGILDIDTNLFSEFRLKREHPDAYESLDASFKVGLARVVSPVLSGTAALATKFSRVEDAFGDNDYLLLSIPVEVAYDTRDNPLEPTRGVSVTAALMPTLETLGGTAFHKTEIHAATYRALTEDGKTILAGRVGAGSIAGASLSSVPASTRFFAGSGGSVRGYEYRSLGPMVGSEVVGGLGYVSASLELRMRITETLGLVSFLDTASVTSNAWPSFSGDFFVGAGVGLRYYTALGPLRIDLAMPLTERDDRAPVAVYVGLGQAF